MKPLPLIRDVVIVVVATAIGGAVVGFVCGALKASDDQLLFAIAASNIVTGSIGFLIAGCLAPPPRWRHLGYVAVVVWLLSIVNVFFDDFQLRHWFGAALWIALTMGIGGSLSLLFKREKT